MFNDGSDGEEHEEVDDFTWRKERIEREKYLQEQQVRILVFSDINCPLILWYLFIQGPSY